MTTKRSIKVIFTEKKLFKMDDVDVKKLLISKKKKKITWYKKNLFKYFIGYNYNDDTRPLCIKLPQKTGYDKYLENNNKVISFKVTVKKL